MSSTMTPRRKPLGPVAPSFAPFNAQSSRDVISTSTSSTASTTTSPRSSIAYHPQTVFARSPYVSPQDRTSRESMSSPPTQGTLAAANRPTLPPIANQPISNGISGLHRSPSTVSVSSVATTRSQRFADATRSVFRKRTVNTSSTDNSIPSPNIHTTASQPPIAPYNYPIATEASSGGMLSNFSKRLTLRRRNTNSTARGSVIGSSAVFSSEQPSTLSNSSSSSSSSLLHAPSTTAIGASGSYVSSMMNPTLPSRRQPIDNSLTQTNPTTVISSDRTRESAEARELRERCETLKAERDLWVRRFSRQLGLGTSTEDPVSELTAIVADLRRRNEQLRALLVSVGAEIPGTTIDSNTDDPSIAPAADITENGNCKSNTRTVKQTQRIQEKIQSFTRIIQMEKADMTNVRNEFRTALFTSDRTISTDISDATPVSA